MVSDLFQGHKGVPTVERKVWVEPSGRASLLQLRRVTEDGETVTIEDDAEIVATVGSVISGLSEW